MNTLFIADLHLSADRPDITALFFEFLATDARRADALYILGDLFEAWIGDDDHNDFNDSVTHAIKRLVDSGVPVYFIHGNRDFLIGKRFARASGAILLPELHTIDLYGRKTLLMHGDSLCTLDHAYQAFRKKSRSWWWQTLMQALPLWYRRRYAANARAKSQQNNQNKAQEIMDVTGSEVVREMTHAGVDLLIHGHTHRPCIHDLELSFTGKAVPAQRIVLGDWYTQGSLLRFSPDGFALENRPLPSK